MNQHTGPTRTRYCSHHKGTKGLERQYCGFPETGWASPTVLSAMASGTSPKSHEDRTGEMELFMHLVVDRKWKPWHVPYPVFLIMPPIHSKGQHFELFTHSTLPVFALKVLTFCTRAVAPQAEHCSLKGLLFSQQQGCLSCPP